MADARTIGTLEPLLLHALEGQPLQLSVQQVQRMTWAELARIWKVGRSFQEVLTYVERDPCRADPPVRPEGCTAPSQSQKKASHCCIG